MKVNHYVFERFPHSPLSSAYSTVCQTSFACFCHFRIRVMLRSGGQGVTHGKWFRTWIKHHALQIVDIHLLTGWSCTINMLPGDDVLFGEENPLAELKSLKSVFGFVSCW